MAKTTTKATGVAGTTKVATIDKELAELALLVNQTATMEESHRDVGGTPFSYLKLLGNTANDPVMRKGKPEYIEGAKEGSWVIPSKGLLLGEEVTLTVLGIFKVYEDSVAGDKDPSSKAEPMRKIVGYWMPEDAEHIPVEGMFDRPFVNSRGIEHILRPVHWARVYLHDFPEIDDALITFRSTGNSVCKQLQKLIMNNAVSSTELRLTMTYQEIESKSYGRAYLYPHFEIAGKNYAINGGALERVRGGFDKDTLTHVVKTAHADQESYLGHQMVQRKGTLANLLSGGTTLALPAGGVSDASVIEDVEDEPIRF